MIGLVERIGDVVSAEAAVTIAAAILVFGALAAYLVWRWTHALFRRTRLKGIVEGTTVERLAGRFGTSTAGVVGMLLALSVYGIAVLFAFNVALVFDMSVFWAQVAALLPKLLVAIFVVIVGFVVGDKAQIAVQERLRSVKLPEVSVIPGLVKYSIYYVAALIALAQVGVATTALVVLLAAYVFGLVLLAAVAFKDLLAAGAAGIYLLLNQPYSIGDEVRIDGRRGIVQEMTMFVTHVETDGEEHIIPNSQVFRAGIVRIRD
jgi:small-conductance mechanosensitive channel